MNLIPPVHCFPQDKQHTSDIANLRSNKLSINLRIRMPLRKELLNICQRIQDEKDNVRLQQLLDELSRVLDEEKDAVHKITGNSLPEA